MQFKEVLEKRQSRHSFIVGKTIDPEDVGKILEACRVAPSAKNRQPWLLKVFSTGEKDRLSSMMCNYYTTNKSSLPKGSSYKNTSRVICEASLLIGVYRVKDDDWRTGDLLSIGGAVENMLLQAVDLGLGGLWIRDTVCIKDYMESLVDGKSKNLELVCSVAFGYPSEWGERKRVKKELKDILL